MGRGEWKEWSGKTVFRREEWKERSVNRRVGRGEWKEWSGKTGVGRQDCDDRSGKTALEAGAGRQ